MGADQPLLEIADGPISKGHNGLLALAQFQTEGLVARDMLEANLRQTREAFETVRVDGGTKCDVPSKKRYYRAGLEVSNYAHASSTGSPTALLHCYQDEGSSPSLSCRLPRRPACSPPIHVSSTSTSPRDGSRVTLTIARRNL